MRIYRICTPGGHLLRRVEAESTYIARYIASQRYNVFTIEEETDRQWLDAYKQNQVTLE